MRWHRIRTIASFELRSTVLRVSFLLASFGLPLLLGGVTGTSAFLQSQLVASQAASPRVVGVVDEAGVFGATPLVAPLVLAPDEPTALESLRRLRIDAVCVVTRDWRTSGRIRLVVRDDAPVLTRDDRAIEQALAESLRRALAGTTLEGATLERVVHPLDVARQRLTVSGVEPESESAVSDAIVAVAVPTLLGILLMSSLLMASGYLVQTIAQDKETKIVEVLLASATADELLYGKLLGLGAAGLTQFSIWCAFGGAAASALLSAYPDVWTHAPIEAVCVAPVFFLLGYAFLGSVMLATGAFGSSAAESQKLVIGWVLLAIVPLVVLPAILESPHGSLALTLTYFPFTAPITIVVRVAIDPAAIPGWELALVALDLVLATAVSLFVGARLFRVGLLLSGTFPGVRAVLAQARRG